MSQTAISFSLIYYGRTSSTKEPAVFIISTKICLHNPYTSINICKKARNAVPIAKLIDAKEETWKMFGGGEGNQHILAP